MDSAMESIAFLARSTNRVQVLRTISEEQPDRSTLREDLPIARTTLARILNEFESRGWITRNGTAYRTTPVAEAILAKFDPLRATVEGIHTLGEAIDWLPPLVKELDFRQFRDCSITKPTTENPAKHLDRGLELIGGASRYRALVTTAIPSYVQAVKELQTAGPLDKQGVIEANFLGTLRDNPERAEPWYAFAASETTWIYHGRVPVDLHIVDDTVLLWLRERSGDELNVYGLLESQNSDLKEWAEELFETYKQDAELLEADMLVPE
jgi:predicted transcriptional regulator